MTRINCVSVAELVDRHLLAEYRELPRVFKEAVRWHAYGGNPKDLPATYRMGEGHVKFFYDKLDYLYKRQCRLMDELICRGYTIAYSRETLWELLENFPDALFMSGWNPTEEALRINRARIADRLAEMKTRREKRQTQRT